MIWHEENQRREEVLKTFHRAGREFPRELLSKLASEPEVGDEVRIYLDAWQDLSTTRQVGFGIGPIPWDKCHLWCKIRGYGVEVEMRIWDVVRRIDTKMVKYWSDSAENKSS